jgi:DNA-binding NarL/FixJ family response regulator
MNILIVDDHAVIRAGLRQLLMSTIGAECWEADSAGAALAIVAERRPDVALLDLGLPALGGLAILPQLREFGVRALVLSMNTDLIYVTRALHAGALGYVSKNVSPDELVGAIQAVADGKRYIEQRLAQALALQGADVRNGLPRLTEREMEIMRLLAAGRSFMEISNAFGVSYKTVANTAGQLRTKLGVARTADLIRLAVEMRGDNQTPPRT